MAREGDVPLCELRQAHRDRMPIRARAYELIVGDDHRRVEAVGVESYDLERVRAPSSLTKGWLEEEMGRVVIRLARDGHASGQILPADRAILLVERNCLAGGRCRGIGQHGLRA